MASLPSSVQVRDWLPPGRFRVTCCPPGRRRSWPTGARRPGGGGRGERGRLPGAAVAVVGVAGGGVRAAGEGVLDLAGAVAERVEGPAGPVRGRRDPVADGGRRCRWTARPSRPGCRWWSRPGEPVEGVVVEALGLGRGAVAGVGLGGDVPGRVVGVGRVVERGGGDGGVVDLGVGQVPGVRVVGVGDVGVAGGTDLLLGDLAEGGVGHVLHVGVDVAAQPVGQVEAGQVGPADGLGGQRPPPGEAG